MVNTNLFRLSLFLYQPNLMIKRTISLLASIIVATVAMTAAATMIVVKPFDFLNNLSTNEIAVMHQDSRGYIWIGTSDGVSLYDGYGVLEFRNGLNSPNLLPSNDISHLSSDDDRVWIGTPKGLALLDRKTYSITPFPHEHLSKAGIRFLLKDSKDNFWVGVFDGVYKCSSDLKNVQFYSLEFPSNTAMEAPDGTIYFPSQGRSIFRYLPEQDSFTRIVTPEACHNNFKMTKGKSGKYWLATWGGGIWEYNPSSPDPTTAFIPHPLHNPIRDIDESIFFDIVQDDSFGYLWALSHFRLYILKLGEDGKLHEVTDAELPTAGQRLDPYRSYSRILKDREGNLWLGAFDQGNTVFFTNTRVKNHLLPKIKHDLGIDPNIITMVRNDDGKIWLNQARYGILLYDEKTSTISLENEKTNRLSVDARFLLPSKRDESVWGCEFSHLMKFKSEGMKIVETNRLELDHPDYRCGNITYVDQDSVGSLWVATQRYLFRIESPEATPNPHRMMIPKINMLTTSADGNVWASDGKRVMMFSPKNGCKSATSFSVTQGMLSGDKITHLASSTADTSIWGATQLGRIFNLDSNGKLRIHTAVNRDGATVKRLLLEGNNLWIISNKNIILYALKTGYREEFHVNDYNVAVPTLRYGSGFVDPSGKLYAGGHLGFITIDPREREIAETGHAISVSDLISDGKKLLFSGDEKQTIENVSLPSGTHNLEIQFSSPNFRDIDKTSYAYRMEGVDKDWIRIENGRNRAFYNSIPKGNHRFEVRVIREDGNLGESAALVNVFRAPAWYETWVAYAVYLLIAVGMLASGISLYARRMRRQNAERMEKKINQTKLNYFANISHELLTPLTVISCVSDELAANHSADENTVSSLRTNVTRLKRLLKQVLDFRKFDSGQMRLRVERRNASTFIRDVAVSNFLPLAEEKNQRFDIRIDDNIWGWLDFGKLDKILFNLLSNAIKYTPDGRVITLLVTTENVDSHKNILIKVTDEGIGIPAKEIGKVFNLFFTGSNTAGCDSNGIGLSLTDKLVRLHHGTISVESKINSGTSFTVAIPLEREEYAENELAEPSALSVNNPELQEEEDKTTVLFIDDNADLRELVKKLLSRDYSVILAVDGEDAFAKLKENPAVDIIVCDVMMPVMDGLEFCRRLKKNVEYNHIPIIMLTAKNGSEDRIECYQAGAESYIAKPFETRLLKSRIENLLMKRATRQQKFPAKMDVNINSVEYQPIDQQFLEQAIAMVEANIEKADFDVEQLADVLGLSPSTLRRKLKVISGLSPLSFIRNIRLKHACMMLADPGINISEVAYAVGFSSPRYFTKCFKEEFGMIPSEYKELKTKTQKQEEHAFPG